MRVQILIGVACLFLLPGLIAAAEPTMPKTVVGGAKLVAVYGDERFFEGPTWDPTGQQLYFTAFGKDTQILRFDGPGKVSIWMDKTAGVNGTYLSKEGRLLGAAAYGHQVVSFAFGHDRAYDPQVLYSDAKLNQPNDLCQAPNGNIYFTDPDFDKRKTSAVFLLTPQGKATKIITDMPVPNGIKTSLDGKMLYVGDSHQLLWKSYPIKEDGTVGPGKVFFNPDTDNKNPPDGMCVDEDGNLYFSGRGGVWVATPEGKSLGLIAIPEFCSNCTFGGKDGKVLFMTCSKKVYSLQMTARGGLFRK